MLWASESRKADIGGAYGPRRGNRTAQSLPIPGTRPGLLASGNGSPLEPLCYAQSGVTSGAPVLRRIIRPVIWRLRPAAYRSEGSLRTPV
jgi:hypothetical protein